jgi:antibiotic biosynthesis monooxygenase (ABM) superfamily enzyme
MLVAMREQLDNAPRTRRWLAPLAMTLGGWLMAFLVVTALLTLLGDELGSLPLALRALVISGVLVALMVNLVMPALNAAISRWTASPPRSYPAGGRSSSKSGGPRHA